MKYEEEEIKDQTTVLLILNTIIAIILGIIFMIIWCVDHVYAAPQYRVSTGSWGEWTNANVDTDYSFATSVGTSWSSYIQLKDTVAFDNNKTYNLNANLEVILRESGTRDMNSALDPYIFNGSTLTNQSDKCTVTGTRSDKTYNSPLTYTTHTYKVNINCVGLNGQGYYPYLALRFKTDSSQATTFTFNIKSWEYHVGSDSTDANNIMNNTNQNTQQIIENYNQNTESIINNQNENTTQVIEALENQNKVCNDNIVYNLEYDNQPTQGYLNSIGEIISHQSLRVTDYLRADGGYTTIFNIYDWYTNPGFCFYTEDKTLISCEAYNDRREITVQNPTNAFYIRATVRENSQVIITTTYCYDYREKETEQMDEILNYNHNFGSQSDTSYANTTHQNEETMVANLDGSLTNVDIDIDSDANGLIWYIIEHTVHANTVVFIMTITILSLGIVKLVLGR